MPLNEIGFDWAPAEAMRKMTQKREAEAAADNTKVKGKVKRKGKNTPWMKRYHQLVLYRHRYGHVLVNQSTQLGNWVKAQRWQYKLMQKGAASSLTSARYALLNELGVFNSSPVITNTAKSVFDKKNVDETMSVRVGPLILRDGMTTDDELLAAWHDRFAAFRA